MVFWHRLQIPSASRKTYRHFYDFFIMTNFFSSHGSRSSPEAQPSSSQVPTDCGQSHPKNGFWDGNSGLKFASRMGSVWNLRWALFYVKATCSISFITQTSFLWTTDRKNISGSRLSGRILAWCLLEAHQEPSQKWWKIWIFGPEIFVCLWWSLKFIWPSGVSEPIRNAWNM